MDEQRLISLRDEYQKNKDTYTPEQQEAMESKFWTLVQKAMAEKEQQTPEADTKVTPDTQIKSPVSRYRKEPTESVIPQPYRVTL